jgi:hypothetical protein
LRGCFRFRSQADHSALDIHSMCMSMFMSMPRLKQQQQQQNTRGRTKGNAPSCTPVLEALTAYDLGISLPTSLDLLWACHCRDVLYNVGPHERGSGVCGETPRSAQATKLPRTLAGAGRIPQSTKRLGLGFRFGNMLRSEQEHAQYRDIKPVPPFHALRARVRSFPCRS